MAKLDPEDLFRDRSPVTKIASVEEMNEGIAEVMKQKHGETVEPDTVEPDTVDLMSLCGMLKSTVHVMVEEMDEAIGDAIVERFRRSTQK